jgi:hypothetical protein
MTTVHEESVRVVLSATEILSGSGYTWMGRRFEAAPDDPTAPAAGRARLLRRLTDRLYADFYCRGGPVPAEDITRRGGPERTSFVEALSAANRGSGSWEIGWTVAGTDDGRLVVERHGLRVWALLEDVAAPRGGPRRPGAPVSVRLPRELPRASPGFYMALGDRGLPPDGELLRVYWNLQAADAVRFVEATTSRLNAAGLPFRLKVVDAVERFTRCDAGVLYLARADGERAAPHIAAVHRELAGRLKPETPAFTKRLAPGVAVADEPREGDSFGGHRCRLLAEGIVLAHERGERTLEGRTRVVAARFAQAGVSLRSPHLEPGSADIDIPLG